MNRDGHLKRMRETAAHFGFLPPDLPDLSLITPPSFTSGLTKCRLLYDRFIRDIRFEAYIPRQISSLIAVEANDLDYAFKYADRSALVYDEWKHKGFDEVLFLKDGFLTDTSFSNVVLRKGNEYITPETYLLNGTQRQFLLKAGCIKEAPIHIAELKQYDELFLINAMLNLTENLRIPITAVRKAE
nr:aminotransferase class IV [Tannerella sp.]